MVNTGATFFFVSHKESVLNRRSLKETLPLIFFFVYKKKSMIDIFLQLKQQRKDLSWNGGKQRRMEGKLSTVLGQLIQDFHQEKIIFLKSKKNKNSYEKEQRKNYAISFNHESLC